MNLKPWKSVAWNGWFCFWLHIIIVRKMQMLETFVFSFIVQLFLFRVILPRDTGANHGFRPKEGNTRQESDCWSQDFTTKVNPVILWCLYFFNNTINKWLQSPEVSYTNFLFFFPVFLFDWGMRLSFFITSSVPAVMKQLDTCEMHTLYCKIHTTLNIRSSYACMHTP